MGTQHAAFRNARGAASNEAGLPVSRFIMNDAPDKISAIIPREVRLITARKVARGGQTRAVGETRSIFSML